MVGIVCGLQSQLRRKNGIPKLITFLFLLRGDQAWRDMTAVFWISIIFFQKFVDNEYSGCYHIQTIQQNENYIDISNPIEFTLDDKEFQEGLITGFVGVFEDYTAIDTQEYTIDSFPGVYHEFRGKLKGIDANTHFCATTAQNSLVTFSCFIPTEVVESEALKIEKQFFEMISSVDLSNIQEVQVTSAPESKAPAAESAAPKQMSAGQQNALKKANSYLKYSNFSYQGLVEQLEYEKFSHEDAVYAVDHCGADWNEQALGKAKSYLDYSAFSYTGLISQLEYEGFTAEQAAYGADNCNADWNEQAAKSAKSYLDYSSFSRDSLIDQLVYEGFTYEQAVYGVDAVGL